MQKYKFTIISLFIIALAAVPLLLLSNSSKLKKAMSPQNSQPSPTAAPLTTSNVEPTLVQTDANIQATLSQVDADLQSAAKIDTTQDSTSGL